MDQETERIWQRRPELEREIFNAWRRAHYTFGFMKRDAIQEYRDKADEFFKYFGRPFSCEDYGRLHKRHLPINGEI